MLLKRAQVTHLGRKQSPLNQLLCGTIQYSRSIIVYLFENVRVTLGGLRVTLSDDNEKYSMFTAVLRDSLEIGVLLQLLNCAKAFLKTIILRPVSSNYAHEICRWSQLCKQIMQIVTDVHEASYGDAYVKCQYILWKQLQKSSQRLPPKVTICWCERKVTPASHPSQFKACISYNCRPCSLFYIWLLHNRLRSTLHIHHLHHK